MQADGSILGIDFARSLAASASLGQVYGLLDKVEAMDPALQAAHISFAEFEAVYRMQCNMHPIKVALEFLHQIGRAIKREDLDKLVIKFANIHLTKQVLDIIMAVFSDGKGSLDAPAFLDAMKRKLNSVHASKFSA